MNSPLRIFLRDMTTLVAAAGGAEAAMLDEGAKLLRDLVTTDHWLPDDCAQPGQDSYRQYLLFCDPLERFSVVSFVWGPGQSTPIHDHTVWGLVGVLRGRERSQRYTWNEAAGRLVAAENVSLRRGEIDRVSPTVGDIHRVWNDLERDVSISIHVYGGNIGAIRRHVYPDSMEAPAPFVSRYSNDLLPNIWLS